MVQAFRVPARIGRTLVQLGANSAPSFLPFLLYAPDCAARRPSAVLAPSFLFVRSSSPFLDVLKGPQGFEGIP